MAQSNITVKVKQLNGPILEFKTQNDLPIGEFKQLVQAASGLSAERQRLIFKARPLQDTGKLSDYVTEDNQIIHLVPLPSTQKAQSEQPQHPQQPSPGQMPFQPPGGMNDIFQMANQMMSNMQRQHGQGSPGGQQGNPLAMLQNMMQGMQPPGARGQPQATLVNPLQRLMQAPPQQQPSPASAPASAPAKKAEPAALKLPHRTVYDLGQICSRMMGRDAVFPGPPMPQLPFDRNPIHQMGSYMSNLGGQLSRLAPFMQRCGDLMQRESLLTNAQERHQVAELIIVLGKALEQVALASGSTAHLYKNFELGPKPGQCKFSANSFSPAFAEIVKQTGTVQPKPPAQQAQPAEEEKKQAAATPAEAKKAEPKSDGQEKILTRMASEFNQLEMINLVTGNFKMIKDFRERCQKVLRNEMADGGETQASRKEFVAKGLAQLNNSIVLPDASKDQIYEQFDPVMIVNEVVTGHAYSDFDEVMAFKGDDQAFAELIISKARGIMKHVIAEIEDGFIEGEEDVIAFLKANFNHMVEAAANPQQAGMAKAMMLPYVIKFIKQCYEDVQKEKEEEAKQEKPAMAKAKTVAEPAKILPQGEVEDKKDGKSFALSEYLGSGGSVEERKKKLIACYKQQVQKDSALENQGRRPLSRAYQSIDLHSNNVLVEEEEKLKLQAFEKDGAEKAKSHSALFKQKMRDSLLDTGLYKSGVVDAEMRKIDADADIPEPLKQAYFDMVRAGIKSRLANDNDYKQIAAKTPDRFQYLSQI